MKPFFVRNLPVSFLICLFSLFFSGAAFPQESQSNVAINSRKAISLLDYISQDYDKAVSKGRILNDVEYQEMLDFSEQTISIFDSLRSKVKIQNAADIQLDLRRLFQLVKQKQPRENVRSAAQAAKKKILLLNLFEPSPASWPSLTAGQQIFTVKCQSCHGATGAGDGPLAASFSPGPANFLNDSLMERVSPLQVFNTARLGIQGTGMRAFDELSDKEIWQVAFYVKSLRFENKVSEKEKSDSGKILNRAADLNDVARLSDEELLEKNGWKESDKRLALIRLYDGTGQKVNTLGVALDYLQDALTFYNSGNAALASQKALDAYLEGVEPIEQQLAATDADIVPELERKMNTLRMAIKAGKSKEEIADLVQEAKITVNKAEVLMGNQTYSFWFTFFMAVSILLREGLEAVLIIVTILSVLQSLNAKQAKKWVHYGWLTAVAIGVISWFFTDLLLTMGAAYREIMEGLGAVVAVAVLLYVGFWLHNKTQAGKWKAFVETRIVKLLDQKKMFGLAFISFLVVFREAFESVIFLSSLHLQVDEDSKKGIWTGSLAAFVGVLLLSQLLLKYSVRLPIRKLFQYSSVIIQALSIVLAGQAVHAFQESGWIGVSGFPLNFRIGVLGVYPTWETYAAQSLVLVITLFFLRRQKKLDNQNS